MTDKNFNTYKDGLDLEFVRRYCREHGTEMTLERGETLEDIGPPALWVAYIEQGCFKYVVHNDKEGRDYCTGFAFKGEFVANYPHCLHGELSELSIEADMPCHVIVISGSELLRIFEENMENMRTSVQVMENLFKMVYGRYLDFYRYTPAERYRQLMARCPQIVQQLSLKDIASFLNVTPVWLSKIRREITFGDEE